MRAVLISCYDGGHQPFGLAEPAAWMRRAGAEVRCLDLAVEHLDEAAIRAADLVAFYVPMHTGTRLAVAVLPRIRRLNPDAHLCFYGLYAGVGADLFRSLGVETLIVGEYETALAALAGKIKGGTAVAPSPPGTPAPVLDRQQFLIPDRSVLPPLSRYARLRHEGEDRLAGTVEASRGCRRLCRHCPIVPIYGGRFRIIQQDIVLDDILQQVAAGARHITFADPDFFNAPAHVLPIVEQFHAQFPQLTYDVTIKVSHLLEYRRHLPLLRDTGCLFVVTAVESFDDAVLERLDKGHTRGDFLRVLEECRGLGLGLSPTFMPFTPWTTLDSYVEMLDILERLRLVDWVAPVQLTIRLLILPGSKLLEVPEIRRIAGPEDGGGLVLPWEHPDPRVDELQNRLELFVAAAGRENGGRREIFAAVRAMALEAAGETVAARPAVADRETAVAVPYLTEPWYC